MSVTTSYQIPGDTAWKVVGPGDFNGDGTPDILFQNQQTGQLVYWQMNGSSYVQWYYINPSLPGPLDWKVVAVTDLNGDGQSDIVFQNQSNGQIVYWIMNGATLSYWAYLPDPGSTDWVVVGAGDFAGNGSNGLLFQNKQTGEIVYWEMNGTTFVNYGFIGGPMATDMKVVGVDDFDGDGQPDILLQSQQTGFLTYWLLNGHTVKGSGTRSTRRIPAPRIGRSSRRAPPVTKSYFGDRAGIQPKSTWQGLPAPSTVTAPAFVASSVGRFVAAVRFRAGIPTLRLPGMKW